MLAQFDRVFTRLNRLACILLLGVMTVLVFMNVVFRYVFDDSLTWVEEVTRYMMIWLAYIGAGLAWRSGSHVAVDLLQHMFPKPVAIAIRIVVVAIVLAFLTALGWFGVDYSEFALDQQSPVLSLPLGLVYASVPAGCVLMAVHVLLGLRDYIGGRAPLSEDELEVLA